MDERDSELNDLLAPLRATNAHDLQLKRWQVAVQNELHKEKTRQRPLYRQVVAALFVGFILGSITISALNRFNENQRNTISKNEMPNATIEYIYAKSK